MRNERTGRPFPFLPAAALAGVVVGHALVYLVAFPAAVIRQQVLAVAGHSYWAAAVGLAIVCASVSVVTTIARHVGRGFRGERPRSTRQRYGQALLRLGTLQSAVFVLQEYLERLHTGAPLSGLFHDGFLAIGVAAQLLVATVVALV